MLVLLFPNDDVVTVGSVPRDHDIAVPMSGIDFPNHSDICSHE